MSVETGELLCSISGLWQNDSFTEEIFNICFHWREQCSKFIVDWLTSPLQKLASCRPLQIQFFSRLFGAYGWYRNITWVLNLYHLSKIDNLWTKCNSEILLPFLCLVETSFFMSIPKVITTNVTNEKIHHQGKRKITQEDWCNRRRLQLRLFITQCCMFFYPCTWEHATLGFCPAILWSNEWRNTSFYLSSVRPHPQENKEINIAVLRVSHRARIQGVTQGLVADIESNGLKIIQIHNLEQETFWVLSWCEHC